MVVILQPYDMEVGAETYPATTLRSLDPNHGKLLTFSLQEDLQMAGMGIIQIDFSIIINFK